MSDKKQDSESQASTGHESAGGETEAVKQDLSKIYSSASEDAADQPDKHVQDDGAVAANLDANANAKEDEVNRDKDMTEQENTFDDDVPNGAQAVFNQSVAAELAVEKVLAPQRQKNKIGWLAFLLALIATAGVAFIGWQGYHYQQRFASAESLARQALQQATEVDSAQQRVNSALQRLGDTQGGRIAQLEASLQQASQRLESQARRLLSLTATTTADWRVAEVEYLLRLANQRLLIAKDAKSALELMSAADQILLELDDPRLFSIRKAIANDRSSITSIAKQDIDGIYLSLVALARQVATLPLDNRPEVVTAASGSSSAQQDQTQGFEQTASSWHAKITDIAASTWHQIKGVVTVQRLAADVKPLLPPEQRYYLRSNLQLLINQAQIALLDGREVVYRESLQSASAWLDEYFSPRYESTASTAAELDRLAMLNIYTEYPDLRESLLAVKAFINEQYADSSNKPSSPQVEEAP